MNNVMINGIFYAITTIALIIYFIKEKKIEKKRKEKSMKKIDDTLTKWNMFMGTERNAIVKFLDGTFSLILVILLVLFIQKFYIGNFTVPTASMEPTVMVGERFFGNMVTPKFKTPKRGSIIIFREPIEDKVRYTKRLVGLAGETVQINDNGKLLINGTPLTDRTYTQDGLLGTGTWTIPKKGDKIKLIDGTFQVLSTKLSFDEIKSYLNKNNGYPLENEGLIPKKIEFSINNQTSKDGLFSYITDMEERFQLLRGETLNKDGKIIRIISGEFYVSRNELSLESVRKELLANPKLDIRLVTANLLLNNKIPTGPISDKEILLPLIQGEEITLSNNYYLAFGDNTTNSSDSRYWGFVKDERILGTLLLRYWPLNKLKVMVNQ
ncbi:MAG: signal peptidase I [Fusobacteriaceae bacterium]|nr:signal peptidase I [Fusobacteriaceae bacterium]MBP6468017.1 signal peptidase I [Fusobacteriaceae bacterium]